jgi:hypothetical protein
MSWPVARIAYSSVAARSAVKRFSLPVEGSKIMTEIEQRCCWCGTIDQYLSTDPSALIQALISRHVSICNEYPSVEQIEAWRNSIALLNNSLLEPGSYGLIFEYTLPRERESRSGSTQRLHWRRGYIKSRPHGPGHSLRQIIWIRPYRGGGTSEPALFDEKKANFDDRAIWQKKTRI